MSMIRKQKSLLEKIGDNFPIFGWLDSFSREEQIQNKQARNDMTSLANTNALESVNDECCPKQGDN